MSRRRIAMRRAVVLGLLLLCVLIFTSFFREDEGGFLHNLKGTVGAVVTPVQEVAVGAVQPVRDGWNWFAELRGARDERNRLREENAALQAELVKRQLDAKVLKDLRELNAIQDDAPDGYDAVAVRVIGRPQIDFSKRAKIDKGRNDAITVNSLVFAPQKGTERLFPALVGIVTDVQGRSATVTFITDPNTQVSARTLSSTKPLGLLKATSSGQLILTQVPSDEPVVEGDTVVTAGFGTIRLPSPYPPGLMIGRVSSVSGNEPGDTQTVQVTPFRNPLELSEFTVFAPRSATAKRRAGVGG